MARHHWKGDTMIRMRPGLILLAVLWSAPSAAAIEPPDLHWPLAGDGLEKYGSGLNAVPHDVDFDAAGPKREARGSVRFNGHNAWLEIPPDPRLNLGRLDFTWTAWVYTDTATSDGLGDILSQYDAARRRGFSLTLKDNGGVTFTQANARHLQFGIDNDQAPATWIDNGRPNRALLVFALCTHQGQLYAGTCEPATGESGRVYRFDGGNRWIDCGAPDGSNSVTAMTVYDSQLYVGTGKYRLAGSSLEESPNTTHGGRVFRYDGDNRWTDCGKLPDTEAVGGMVVYDGRLYASSLYGPAGFFRYEGDQRWTDAGTPEGGRRVEAMTVYNGHLYATSYDVGRVFRYDGFSWLDFGQLGDPAENTQTYSFAVYQGRLHVGTWRSGRVYRLEDVGSWTDVGRLGEELEVMGMLVHNGRLIAGTLPQAEVYSYEGDSIWKRLACLDATPDVRYRRAWTMAEYRGRVFCSTLPSGKVFSYRCGMTASWDWAFPAEWHQVAAVRRSGRLELYVDGRRVARSPAFDDQAFELTNDQPLRIGWGPHDYFRGRIADLRLYRRALGAAEIAELAAE
jgi:hypothetical protein